MRLRGTVRRAAIPVGAAAIVVVALAGCVPTAPIPTKTAAAPTSSASATPEAPTIDLAGTAGQNQAYFDAVNQKFIAAGGDLGGRPFIDDLVKAGYPKVAMEVTPDRTSVNLAADNIQFSIRFGTTCLIGQYGNIGYASTITTVLGTGRCLVGTTRPIDW
ncbi:MAG: hypothetical protein M3N46_10645 [Actinomycetota bacterium]|nr:hypothetical protein [Actinomycetota bacterium]